MRRFPKEKALLAFTVASLVFSSFMPLPTMGSIANVSDVEVNTLADSRLVMKRSPAIRAGIDPATYGELWDMCQASYTTGEEVEAIHQNGPDFKMKLRSYTIMREQQPSELAQNWDMAQLTMWRLDKVPQVHALNPAFKALLYRNFRAVYPYVPEEFTVFEQNGWLAKDEYGRPVYSTLYPQTSYQLVDIGHPDYHTWVANWLKERLDQYGCDGVFLDNSLSPHTGWLHETTSDGGVTVPARVINPRTGQLWTNEESKQACIGVHAKIKSVIGNKLLVANSIWSGMAFWEYQSGYEDLVSRSPLDGFMSEGTWYNVKGQWMTMEQWRKTIDFVVEVQDRFLTSPNRVFVPVVQLETDWQEDAPFPPGCTKEQMFTYAFASTLLAIKNNQNYLGISVDPIFARDVVRPLHDIDLGDPLGDYYQIEETHVYARDFTNVKVLVNPTEYTFVVDLGIGTIKMQPHIGVGIDQQTGEILFGVSSGRFDLNFDGIININDLVIVAIAFGSYPGHPRWNPLVDLNYDDVIGIVDVVIVAKEFGKIA